MDLPEPLPRITATLLTDLATTLRRDLVAVVAYGSAVSGGFDPASSDLDLCVVTARSTDAIDLGLLHGLVRRLSERDPVWAERLDIVFVGRSTLTTFRAGGPLVSISHDEPLRRFDDAADWLQTWYLVRSGRSLVGLPAEVLIPPISTAEFTTAVASHTRDLARRAPTEQRAGALAYVVLTLCRVLCLLETGRQVPKRVAAAWLVEQRPDARSAIDLAVAVSSERGQRPLASQELATIRRLIATLGAEVESRIAAKS